MFTGGNFTVTPLSDRKVHCIEEMSEEQKEFALATEDFATEELLPRKDAIEQFNGELTKELIRKCGELGLLGVDVPEEYDGLDLGKFISALVVEKITYGQSASFTVTFSAHTGIGTLPIVYFGNEEQKKKYLPGLASGEILSAYALTEPGAGTDALAIRTSAELTPDGKYYILNGNKQFISNGGWADLLITFAKIDGEKLTCFLVDPTAEGVIRKEEKNKLGLHGSSTCNIILENVKVPVENVLGKVGHGAEIAFNTLNIGRFKLGAAVLGGSKNTLILSLDYALQRKQFGQAIAKFDAIKKKFAEMVIRTYALESIVYQTAGLLDESIEKVDSEASDYYQQVALAIEKFAIECSICKVYGSEVLSLNADEGLQVFGGYGFMEDYPLARIWRDTRIDRIYEGTNEINRQIILGYILKKTLLEELPIREKIKEIPRILEGKQPEFPDAFLAEEKRATELAKYLFLYVYNQALTEFGQDILNRQQIGEVLSDMIINLFVLDTTLARISQTAEQSPKRQLAEAIGKVLTAETVHRMSSAAELVLNGVLGGKTLDNALQDVQSLSRLMFLKTDVFSLKNLIADHLYEQRKYPF